MALSEPAVLSGLPGAHDGEDDNASDVSSSVELDEIATTEDVMDWKLVSPDFYLRRWRMFSMSW